MDKNSKEENNLQKQYFSVKESLSVLTGNGSKNISVEKLEVEGENDSESEKLSWKELAWHYYKNETLLIEVVLVIILAKIYPPLGGIYFFPDITAHWIAVIVIFFLSGFALRLEELTSAASNIKFNAFVILYNFMGISCVVNFVAKFFYNGEVISEDLMKGMIICSCLSMPTNMMIVLTISSKGDEAVALFLATTMNLLGVFVTPLLIYLYLQDDSDIDFLNTYRTISLRVLLPVAAGLVMKNKINGAHAFADEHSGIFFIVREKCLVFIVYTTFCHTFMDQSDSTGAQILVMVITQIILLSSAMIIAWIALFMFFNRQPKLRVCGIFGCSTKTAALGIPLISAIYEDHPKLGIYTLPLLIWYFSQLVIGTVLSSRLSRFVDYKLAKYERERQQGNYQPKGCGLIGKPSWA